MSLAELIEIEKRIRELTRIRREMIKTFEPERFAWRHSEGMVIYCGGVRMTVVAYTHTEEKVDLEEWLMDILFDLWEERYADRCSPIRNYRGYERSQVFWKDVDFWFPEYGVEE